MTNRVYIFDTTLRDGEQSPGCSMTVPEKLRLARKLVELGVDILEAGFPIASEGDYEAVDAVSREFSWVQVAALARPRLAHQLCSDKRELISGVGGTVKRIHRRSAPRMTHRLKRRCELWA